jgi:hypothetical protein
MFRSYDHLQVEIYTFEINMTGNTGGRFVENVQVVTDGELLLCVAVVFGVVFILDYSYVPCSRPLNV